MAQFATLAENTLRALAKPGAISVPAALAAVLSKHGMIKGSEWRETDGAVWLTAAAKRRLFGEQCREAIADIREAPKFVFGEDFSRLIIETAEQRPSAISRIAKTARVPFETCWIEWDRTSSPDYADPKYYGWRWGALFRPFDVDETEIMVVYQYPDKSPIFMPGGLIFNFQAPARIKMVVDTDHDPDDLNGAWDSLGADYYKRWKKREPEIMQELAQHFKYALDVPPIGDCIAKAAEKCVDPREALLEFLGLVGAVIGGSVRELICGLALLATHIGGRALIKHTAAATRTHFITGKFHPGFEYKIVDLVRPMKVPRLMRAVFPERPRSPVAHHPVLGAWHHRRAPAPNCRVHPSECTLANWHAVVDEDGNPVGSQIQSCALCHRRRWYQKGHHRGDPTIGQVDKDYNVVTDNTRKAA